MISQKVKRKVLEATLQKFYNITSVNTEGINLVKQLADATLQLQAKTKEIFENKGNAKFKSEADLLRERCNTLKVKLSNLTVLPVGARHGLQHGS